MLTAVGLDTQIRFTVDNDEVTTLPMVRSCSITFRGEISEAKFLGLVELGLRELPEGADVQIGLNTGDEGVFDFYTLLINRRNDPTQAAVVKVNLIATAALPSGAVRAVCLEDLAFGNLGLNITDRDQPIDFTIPGRSGKVSAPLSL